jgi:hypothetical protein
VLKKLSKSCQKVFKVVKKLFKFKTSGEEEEEDWWLQDQVATSSHLVKSVTLYCVGDSIYLIDQFMKEFNHKLSNSDYTACLFILSKVVKSSLNDEITDCVIVCLFKECSSLVNM